MLTDPTLWGTKSALSRDGETRFPRHLVLLLRLAAVVVAAILLVLVWTAMSLLPWEADALIALTATLAWAYTFERDT